MRRNQCTLSGKSVSGFVVNILQGAFRGLQWVGHASVTSLLLVQVLVRASAERRSLDAISRSLGNAPSVETIRKALLSWLPASTEAFEPVIPQALHGKLPRALNRRPRTMAIDFHEKPYYGDKQTPGIRRGKPKASTKRFFVYATLMVIRMGMTFTVGLVHVPPGADLTTIIDKLLQQAAVHGLKPKKLLLDRGFYGAKVMLDLQERKIPFVMPMIRRGKSGQRVADCTGTAQFFVKGREGWAKYEWEARIREEGQRTPRCKITTEVCMMARPGKSPLVYACWGIKRMAPKEVAALYRRRFRIETSYRQMHEGLAMTCSKNPVYRLLLVLIALVLRNLWLWLHWTYLSERDRANHRVIQLAPCARSMLHWIVRFLDKKLSIAISVTIPSPAASAA